MLILTRADRRRVIVGTVLLSLGTSFGLSVLFWQYVLGLQLHWMILAMSVIILLAVGSDYNLLLVSRFKEELHAGIKTGIIRSMAGTGAVVTSAGLVFAFTMISLVISDLMSWSGGQHHRPGSAVRHSSSAIVHDAVDRGAAGPLVLVADQGATAAGQHHAPVRAGPARRCGRCSVPVSASDGDVHTAPLPKSTA